MKKRMKFLIITVVLMVCVVATYIVNAQTGGSDDPVISLSYLKQIFEPEITEQLSFKVVSLQSGKKIVCDAGTELILRMGTATVVATEKGGLADVTAGYDLADGTQMPANHQLIVPLDDGRGVKAATDCLIMIKGGYEIQ